MCGSINGTHYMAKSFTSLCDAFDKSLFRSANQWSASPLLSPSVGSVCRQLASDTLLATGIFTECVSSPWLVLQLVPNIAEGAYPTELELLDRRAGSKPLPSLSPMRLHPTTPAPDSLTPRVQEFLQAPWLPMSGPMRSLLGNELHLLPPLGNLPGSSSAWNRLPLSAPSHNSNHSWHTNIPFSTSAPSTRSGSFRSGAWVPTSGLQQPSEWACKLNDLVHSLEKTIQLEHLLDVSPIGLDGGDVGTHIACVTTSL